ncbi:hypothetical protein HN928_00155, partial [bacterium]|nr:hypothetical protein [bacterium]
MYLCKVVAMPSPVVEEVESVTRPSRVELFEEEQSDLTRLKLKALVPQAQTLNTNLSKS